MKDIHEVLRRKQAKYAQLSKQIEALQQAAEKLREVAPLLAESDEEESAVLAEVEDQNSLAAGAGASPSGGLQFRSQAGATRSALAVIRAIESGTLEPAYDISVTSGLQRRTGDRPCSRPSLPVSAWACSAAVILTRSAA